jgi:hypothetical protein
LMQYNPGVALANQLRKAIFGAAGAGEDKFTGEDLFGQGFDFKFGSGLGDKPLPTGGEDDEDGKKKKMRTASEEMLALALQRNEAARNRNLLEVELLDYAMRTQSITEQFNAGEINFALAKTKDLENEERLRDRILRLRKQEKREMAQLSKKQKEAKKELTETEKVAAAVVTTFADGMSNAFFDLINKAKSFREVLSGLLQDVAKLVMQMGMRIAAKGLFPDLFAGGGIMSNDGAFPLKRYARGGVANSPQLAMFGEGSTPEAYVPLPDGRTIPVTMKNGGKGVGNVVVNVDATGSSAEGDSQQANRLGEAIGVAVRQELIKQQRPGGLLA